MRSLTGHWIFRVSVLLGPEKTDFIEKGLRKIAAGEEYIVAAGQVGSATYTRDGQFVRLTGPLSAGRNSRARGGLSNEFLDGNLTKPCERIIAFSILSLKGQWTSSPSLS